MRSVLVIRACGLLMTEDKYEVCVDMTCFDTISEVMKYFNHKITSQNDPKPHKTTQIIVCFLFLEARVH